MPPAIYGSAVPKICTWHWQRLLSSLFLCFQTHTAWDNNPCDWFKISGWTWIETLSRAHTVQTKNNSDEYLILQYLYLWCEIWPPLCWLCFFFFIITLVSLKSSVNVVPKRVGSRLRVCACVCVSLPKCNVSDLLSACTFLSKREPHFH